MRLGRRPYFFAFVAVACLSLFPVTPGEFRWVNVSMASLAAFWAIAIAVEDLTHTRRRERGGPAP